jgi:hypothetical protein
MLIEIHGLVQALDAGWQHHTQTIRNQKQKSLGTTNSHCEYEVFGALN